MAKRAWIERNRRKAETVRKYAELRAELRAQRDYEALSRLPRNASPTRVVNRCNVTGRRHGFFRKFGCLPARLPGDGALGDDPPG